MSVESLAIFVAVGLIAGWLAEKSLQTTGFGLVGALIVGVVGALIGVRFLPEFDIQLGDGIVSALFTATIGAVALLVLVRLLRGGEVWRGSSERGL